MLRGSNAREETGLMKSKFLLPPRAPQQGEEKAQVKISKNNRQAMELAEKHLLSKLKF